MPFFLVLTPFQNLLKEPAEHIIFFIFIFFNIYFIWQYLPVGSFTAVHGCSSCGNQAWLLGDLWDLSSLTRHRTHIPCTAKRNLNRWTIKEIPLLSTLNPSVILGLQPRQEEGNGLVTTRFY